MPPQLIGPFIFRDLGYLYWLEMPGQVPCVGLILPCRNFRLLPSCYAGRPSASLVKWLPCIWIAVLLSLISIIKVVVSPFLSRLACQILSLTNKHGITLLPAYIPTHLNVEADFLSQDQLLLEWHLLPQVAHVAFCLWGLPEVDLLASSHSSQCQHYFTLETPLPVGALGLNAFSHPWTFQVSYVFPPLALIPLVLSKFLAEHVNGQLRHLILVAPCWVEAPWLLTVLNMLANVPRQCPIVKDLIMDVSVGQALKGLQYLHLTLWQLSDVCYADRGSLPQSVRQWWGQLEHLHQRSTSSAGRNELVGVLNRVYQTMASLPLN